MSSSSSSNSMSRTRDRSSQEDLQLLENACRGAQREQSDLLEPIPRVYYDPPPKPPPFPDPYEYIPHPSGSMRKRFKTVLTAPKANVPLPVDLEANIPPPPPPPPQTNIGVHVDLEAANIPQPAEPAPPILIVPNLVVRIRILVDRIRIFIAGLFTRVRLLVADLCGRVWILADRLRVIFANFFARIRIFFEYLYARIWVFIEYVSATAFVRYLVKRNEEFRPEEEPQELKPRLVSFQSNSTPANNRFWKFYKWMYVVSVWLMVLSLFAGGCYWKFGEGGGSNPKSFRFKDESIINFVVAVGLVSTVVYCCWAIHQWNELKLFKIRSYHIGFLALDIICDLRSLKAVALTCYGFYDLAKEYGVWTDIVCVGFPVFYSIWSLSILILFQHEFYHAHGLINDFIVIFVGPMMIQFAHGSILNGVLYAIPIVFGRLSKFLGYIYRPHVTNDFYNPTTPIN